MKAKEIVDLTTDEIVEKIGLEEEGYSKLKLNHAISDLENPLQIKYKRRDLARLKTELQKRRIQESKGSK